MTTARRLLPLTALLLAPAAAQAHPAITGVGGFAGGFLHPFFVPAHVMAIAAAALLLAQDLQRKPHAPHWPGPGTFAAGLIAGFVVIANAYTPASTGEALLGLAAISAVTVAMAHGYLPFTALLLAGLTGFVVALDSPPDAIAVSEAILMQLGTFCGALALFVLVTEIAVRLQRQWQRVAIRILGAWIAASAILVLALRLAR